MRVFLCIYHEPDNKISCKIYRKFPVSISLEKQMQNILNKVDLQYDKNSDTDQGNKFGRDRVSMSTPAEAVAGTRAQNAREWRALAMYQELFLNLCTSDMSPRLVEFGSTSSILLCKRLFSSFACFQAVATTRHAEASLQRQIHTLLSHHKHFMLVQQPQWTTPLLLPLLKFASAGINLGQNSNLYRSLQKTTKK